MSYEDYAIYHEGLHDAYDIVVRFYVYRFEGPTGRWLPYDGPFESQSEAHDHEALAVERHPDGLFETRHVAR